ncbi:MAG: wax ester/triacylglycerol synthase family O-acyltransferase [Candidatus Nanopelagicales bacterium]
MTVLDDTFIVLERDNLPMHIGSLLIFDGAPPEYEELLAHVAGRLHRLPRYRQVIREVPFSLGRPTWEDDQHFNLEYHVRHTAVPHPGDRERVRALAGRLLGQRLDLRRPLWELWLVEGLADDKFAILNKIHHSMVDGMSGADLMEVILDESPNMPTPPPVEWHPQPPRSTASVLAGAFVDTMRNPVERLGHLAADLGSPQDALNKVAAALAGTLRIGETLAHTEDHLLGQPGPHRRWAWADGDLNEVKRIKREFGGTVNDVILAAITNGYRQFLLGREPDLPQGAFVRTLVPVSTRPPGAPKGGNEVAVMFADLPVGLPDPLQRLEAIHEQMQAAKSSGTVEGFDSLLENAVFVPPMLYAAAGRLAARTPQPAVSTITTNVPGPQQQLYLLGSPMQRMLGYVPLGMNQLVTVAIVSYNGQICCGITADYDQVPDVEVLAQGIESGLAELSELAG